MFRYLIMCAALVSSNFAFAGTQILGFEIGVSTVDQVKKALDSNASVQSGMNQLSGGVSLQSDGSGYGLDGLKEVYYVFDKQQKLEAVNLTMDKSQLESILKLISSKHKISYLEKPFVGNAYARFNTPDTTIEINAPHMSFEMDVTYTRNDFKKQIIAQSKINAASKQKRAAANF